MKLQAAIGMGVAGNFAGHLEQAGEAADFAALGPSPEHAPKGIFPFYVPAEGTAPIAVFPLDAHEIRLPAGGESLQLEPELALVCRLEYSDGRVAAVEPQRFGAYNDCSIRRPGARKISEKKNWGAASKGLSETLLPIDRFAPGGVLDGYRIACWLERDGALHDYGLDSAVRTYTYFYARLLEWLAERLRTQRDEGPLEDMAVWLAQAGYPETAVISVGATRYTEFGERTFVREGDVAHIAVYDESLWTHDRLAAALRDGGPAGPGLSLLSQRVVAQRGYGRG